MSVIAMAVFTIFGLGLGTLFGLYLSKQMIVSVIDRAMEDGFKIGKDAGYKKGLKEGARHALEAQVFRAVVDGNDDPRLRRLSGV